MKETQLFPKITDDFVKLYEDYLVPIIYAQWSHHLVENAEIDSGHHVLDVACGTGTAAQAALLETGLKGKVTGLERNEKMLALASEKSSQIDWQPGSVTALPFEDNCFDRVLCQFALMFIGKRIAALKEMLRVCKPGGRVVVAIWAPLDQSQGYTALVDLTRKYAGQHAAFKLATPWALGEAGKMDAVLLSSGVKEYECHERVGRARFPSIESFIEVHLRSAGVFHELDEERWENMLLAAQHVLAPFVLPTGEIAAELDANIFVVSPD